MQQRDIIKDQIEQISRILAKALNELLGFSGGDPNEGIELSQKELESELDINLAEMIKWDQEELNQFLSNRNFDAQSAEKFADYLSNWAQVLSKNDPSKALSLIHI